jgi:hypothetical protein
MKDREGVFTVHSVLGTLKWNKADFQPARTLTVLTVTVPPPAPTSTNIVYVTVNQPASYTSYWTQESTVTGKEIFDPSPSCSS